MPLNLSTPETFIDVFLSLSPENRARIGKLIHALHDKDIAALKAIAADASLSPEMAEQFQRMVVEYSAEWEVMQ